MIILDIFRIVNLLDLRFDEDKVRDSLITIMFDMENGRPPICQDAEARTLCMNYLK